jgi:hypothetical protein
LTAEEKLSRRRDLDAMRRSQKREKALKLALLIGSAAISILLLEFGLRRFAPQAEMAAGTTDTPKAALYGWALPPNTVMTTVDPDTRESANFSTNSQGWKDEEHQFIKPEGVFRILFIGDSITAGRVAPRDLYTVKVREMLLELQVTNVEVISIGMGAWGTDQILEALKLEGIRYDPDVVIYQFNTNDLTDNLSPNDNTPPQEYMRWAKPFRYEIRGGELDRISIESSEDSDDAISTFGKYLRRSAIISNLARVFDRIRDSLVQAVEDEKAEVNWWDDHPINPVTPIRYYKGDQTPEMELAWDLMEALILEMKATSDSIGAEYIVFATDGEDGYRHWNLAHGWMHNDEGGDYILWEGEKLYVNWNLPLERLVEIAARHDILLIEPTRAYERFRNDAHPNPVGNLNMALDIVDYLLEQDGLLPR